MVMTILRPVFFVVSMLVVAILAYRQGRRDEELEIRRVLSRKSRRQ